MQQKMPAFTVSQVNAYVKMYLDRNEMLSDLWISGEISNFTNHYKSGHLYFSLKDAESVLHAVMFRSYASELRFNPENGIRVLVHGRVSLYPRDGQYQLYVDRMEPNGIGSLYLAFEQSKQKLAAMGLFDRERKKTLPHYPKCIGIVTSPIGAAIRDIIDITGRRFPSCDLILFPALVQGKDAPASLRSGILYFNRARSVDLIIIGRGGGSFEDLFAFNDEALAMAIADSQIPVISAVGHETDTTICDFVADMRAPTPSAAAELAVPNVTEISRHLHDCGDDMFQALSRQIDHYRKHLRLLTQSGVLSSPTRLLELRQMEIANAEELLDAAMAAKLERENHRFHLLCGRMDALSPLRVLARGYSVTETEDGSVLTDVRAVSPGTPVHIRLHKGTLRATVTDTETEMEESAVEKRERS